jgi:hypothetical protein
VCKNKPSDCEPLTAFGFYFHLVPSFFAEEVSVQTKGGNTQMSSENIPECVGKRKKLAKTMANE